ncbi:S-(hydroxymethyl)mycothiol dehydrogenase, partial [Kocuria sp. CPCC 205236]
SRDFPMLVDQYRLGRLDLDGFVTERIGLGDVEEAFAKMKAGTVLRSVVELDRAATGVEQAGDAQTGVAAPAGAAR